MNATFQLLNSTPSEVLSASLRVAVMCFGVNTWFEATEDNGGVVWHSKSIYDLKEMAPRLSN